jgi:hypothetical protein
MTISKRCTPAMKAPDREPDHDCAVVSVLHATGRSVSNQPTMLLRWNERDVRRTVSALGEISASGSLVAALRESGV